MTFPQMRLRRMRRTGDFRRMVRETHLTPDQLIYPIFIADGLEEGRRVPVDLLPGLEHLSIAAAVDEAAVASELGIPALMLFGMPSEKDEVGSFAWDEDGPVQSATRAIKAAYPNMLVTTDVCLCAYTTHGHCGPITTDGCVDNDTTNELLARMALSHANAGADMVVPSDMMDGRIGVVRELLDEEGYSDTAILAHSAKYASCLYAPFRDVTNCGLSSGDRKGYQLDPANGREAVREALLDIEEGADIVLIKPAISYLDVVARIRDQVQVPIATFNVGGEYAMVKAAVSQGLLDERATVLELLTSMRRAGADIIVSYHAKDAAKWLQ